MNYGLLPTPHDERDLTVGAIMRLPSLIDLPLEHRLSYPTEWILEQSSDTCAGHASSLASSFQEGIRLDPLFTWVIARDNKGMQPGDWGCDLRAIADAHVKTGALRLNDSPYNESYLGWRDIRTWAVDVLKKRAITQKKGSYLWIEQMQGYDYFDVLRALLFKLKTPIVIGLKWPYDERPMVDKWQEGGFGHAVTVVGWELRLGKPFLVIANSWGIDSGKNGEFYLSREVINKGVPDFKGFLFYDEDPETIRKYIERGINLDDSMFTNLRKTIQSKLIEIAHQLTHILQQVINLKPPPMREQLYQAAFESLGKEMSPKDLAPDDVACAESFCNVVRKVLPDFPIFLSTKALYDHLRKDTRFKPTLDPERGNVIISVTGAGNGTIPGHVGIHLGNGRIASNSSFTRPNSTTAGLWEDNFSIEAWVKRYRTMGGMRLHYFTLV